jgi:hypothetical protein
MRVVPLPAQRGHMMLLSKLMRYRMAALLIGCVLTGCGTTKSEPVAPDFCATSQPIFVDKTDIFTDATAKAILRHNLTGRKLCGW